MRLFIFTQLPAEIRLQIYAYVLQARVSVADRRHAHLARLHFQYNGGQPHMNILRTCQQIWHEGWDYIYTSRYFEVGLFLTNSGMGWLRSPSPIESLQFSPMKKARLYMSTNEHHRNREDDSSYDIIMSLSNIQKLEVVITDLGKPVDYEGWINSPHLAAMIYKIIERVPAHVDLRWRPWDFPMQEMDPAWDLCCWRTIDPNAVKHC